MISDLQLLLFHDCSHYSSIRTQRAASTKLRALLLLGTQYEYIHDMVHLVAGYEFHRNLDDDTARTGDGMHVPRSCSI